MLVSDLLTQALSWNPGERDLVLLGAVDDDIAVAEALAEALPDKTRGRIFLEVASADKICQFSAPGRMCVTWLSRDRGQSIQRATQAWLSEMLLCEHSCPIYAWLSGQHAARTLTHN